MNKITLIACMSIALFVGCKTSNKSSGKTGMQKKEKGAVIGASTGAVVGGMIGNKSDNTVLGAILGAAIGGSAGVIIGNKMDKQAKKMEEDLGNTATVERVGEGIKLTFNSQLLFDFGKTDLKEANKADLKKFAETLKQYPGTDMLIVGHTDDTGPVDFNQALSEKRANAVCDQLELSGVNSSRMRKQGLGETQPAVLNDTESNRTQNRRVEIAIFANEQMKTEAGKEVGN
jgi:outer membrane protein OmpA-like peptidoglycan-associated protein